MCRRATPNSQQRPSLVRPLGHSLGAQLQRLDLAIQRHLFEHHPALLSCPSSLLRRRLRRHLEGTLQEGWLSDGKVSGAVSLIAIGTLKLMPAPFSAFRRLGDRNLDPLRDGVRSLSS